MGSTRISGSGDTSESFCTSSMLPNGEMNDSKLIRVHFIIIDYENLLNTYLEHLNECVVYVVVSLPQQSYPIVVVEDCSAADCYK